MKTLLVLRDKDVGFDTPEPATYEVRTAARAVVFDKDENVALLYSTVHDYHKLPGGGVEEGEELLQALEREVKEEIGCRIENISGLGSIEEYRMRIALHQWSHCYIAHQVGEKGASQFVGDELEEGFVVQWIPLTDAIKTLESELDRDHYLARFMTRRDLTFLRAVHIHES